MLPRQVLVVVKYSSSIILPVILLDLILSISIKEYDFKKFWSQYENKKEDITRRWRISSNEKLHEIHKILGELI